MLKDRGVLRFYSDCWSLSFPIHWNWNLETKDKSYLMKNKSCLSFLQRMLSNKLLDHIMILLESIYEINKAFLDEWNLTLESMKVEIRYLLCWALLGNS